jgi:hypothetical protein
MGCGNPVTSADISILSTAKSIEIMTYEIFVENLLTKLFWAYLLRS